MADIDIYARIINRLNDLQELRAEGRIVEMGDALADLIEWFEELDENEKTTVFLYTIGRIGG